MYAEGSDLLDLSAAFDTQLREFARPSAAGLLRLYAASPQNLIPPPQTAYPLAPIIAVKAACEEELVAAAALAAESAACAAAVAALIPAVSIQERGTNTTDTAKVPASVCAGGCVPRIRAALGAGLARCARKWAITPVLQGDLQFAGGTVPLVLNTSWILQVVPNSDHRDSSLILPKLMHTCADEQTLIQGSELSFTSNFTAFQLRARICSYLRVSCAY